MEIRIQDQHVETLLAMVDDEYRRTLEMAGNFTVKERQNQVDHLEELTFIRDALQVALRDGGTTDIGWQLVEE